MNMKPEQLEQIKEQFKTLKERSSFYARKFEGIDLSDVQSQEDFQKLPFSEKADLREVYPLGLAAVPEEKLFAFIRLRVLRVHLSLFLILKKMLLIGQFSLLAAMKLQALPIKTAFI